MAKASAFSLACSTEPSPSMRKASARDSASALAVPVLSTAVLEGQPGSGDTKKRPGPALLHPHVHTADAIRPGPSTSCVSKPRPSSPLVLNPPQSLQLQELPASLLSFGLVQDLLPLQPAAGFLLKSLSFVPGWERGPGRHWPSSKMEARSPTGTPRAETASLLGARGKHSVCKGKGGVRAGSPAGLQAPGKECTCDPRPCFHTTGNSSPVGETKGWG